jgi:hypothetical protein
VEQKSIDTKIWEQKIKNPGAKITKVWEQKIQKFRNKS